MDRNKELWDKCIALHGHACGGLAVGYQASLYAMEQLGISRGAIDEELVCITENDACGVDAVQAMLGCTLGKGNLLIKLRGKQAFSFFDRRSGKSLRLVLRRTPELSRQEREVFLMSGDYHDMFDLMPVRDALPEPAVIFKTCVCSDCGEPMSEKHSRLSNGKLLCEDCYGEYKRWL